MFIKTNSPFKEQFLRLKNIKPKFIEEIFD